MKKFSNYLLTIFIILFAIGLILFSDSNIETVQNSLDLFLNAIFPSLFPFLIITQLISHTFIISVISSKFGKFMKKLFNLPEIAAYPFIIGIIAGYPVGAKIVSELRNHNEITPSEGNILLVITNNAGPLFIIGSIGCSIFINFKIGILLFFINFISCIISGILLGHFYKLNYRISGTTNSEYLDFESLGNIISDSIKRSFFTLSNVCGFIILFSLIVSMIKHTHILEFIFIKNTLLESLFLGSLEISSGIKEISLLVCSSKIKLVCTSFLLAFGGISVIFQIWSTISDSDLSIKPYIIGKLLSAFLSSVFMFVITSLITI